MKWCLSLLDPLLLCGERFGNYLGSIHGGTDGGCVRSAGNFSTPRIGVAYVAAPNTSPCGASDNGHENTGSLYAHKS